MAKIPFDAETRGAVKAVNDLNKALGKTDDQLDEITKGGSKAEKAARRFAEMADPTRKYERQLANVAKAVKEGGLALDDAKRVAAQYGDRLDRVSMKGKQAFGPQLLGGMFAAVQHQVSLNNALEAGNQLLAEEKRLREQAKMSVKSAAQSLAELAQLAAAGGSTQSEREKRYGSFVVESLGYYGRGGAGSIDAAAQDVYRLDSAGLSRADRDFARDLKASGAIANVGALAESYSAIKTNLPSVGDFDDFTDRALQAASVAPAQAPEIPLAASKAAGSAKSLGIGDTFLLAAAGVLAKSTGSAEQGGTQLAALLKSVESRAVVADPTLRGLSGLGLVGEIKSRDLDRAGLVNLLGDDQTAISGYRALSNDYELLGSQVAAIQKADADDLAQQAANLPKTVPFVRASISSQKALALRKLSELDTVTQDLLIEEALDTRRTNRRLGTESQYGDLIGDAIRRNFPADNATSRRKTLEQFLGDSEAGVQPLGSDLEEQIRDSLSEQNSILREIRDLRAFETSASAPE